MSVRPASAVHAPTLTIEQLSLTPDADHADPAHQERYITPPASHRIHPDKTGSHLQHT
jgi:hypothetical protein